MGQVLLLHAGAGQARSASQADQVDSLLREACLEACLEGDAQAMCLRAVAMMEDFPLLNAGRGSALAEDGKVYMDASVMSSSGEAGSVCGLQRVRHASQAAACLMGEPLILWAGHEDALRSRYPQLKVEPEQWFHTDVSLPDCGCTVGAVALDSQGQLFAATSTGGLRGKLAARVGDSALIGAGTWASPDCAVSCTGDGEAFMLAAAASCFAQGVSEGRSLTYQANAVLCSVAKYSGQGGLVAVSADGEIVALHSSPAMQWACLRDGKLLQGGRG